MDFLVNLLPLPCASGGMALALMRPDLRLPSSVKVVGPSASTFFQGGDTTFDLRAELGGGVESRVRRRFDGRSSAVDSGL